MEMQQVRYFVALAELRNFTRAAETCNVTQPAFSRAIQQLEHELGGPLVNRERGNLHLTELGRMMLPYLAQIAEQAQSARDLAKAATRLQSGKLRIGAMCTIGAPVLAELIIRFRTAHPHLEISMIEDEAPQMLAMLEQGKLEVAVVGIPDELPEHLHHLPIFEERFVLVLPPNHRLTAKNPVPCADLHGEPYVCRALCEVHDHVARDLHKRGIDPVRVFSSPRDSWVQNMIKAGLGFGFFPEFAVTDPDVVVRPLVEPAYKRTIYLTTMRGRPHSPAVGAFVREARAYRAAAGIGQTQPTRL
jgi:DNA-binding transcriptional LysR family regulator